MQYKQHILKCQSVTSLNGGNAALEKDVLICKLSEPYAFEWFQGYNEVPMSFYRGWQSPFQPFLSPLMIRSISSICLGAVVRLTYPSSVMTALSVMSQ